VYVVEAPRRVEAEMFLRPMTTGRNGAVLLRARDPEGAPVDCVVKLAKAMAAEHAQLVPIPYLCEWLAFAIGRTLRFPVPAAYDVIITKEYAEAILDDAHRNVALGSLGSAFGCQHVSEGTSQYLLELPDPALRGPAAELIGFDVFIHNPDRRRTNPNLFVMRGQLVPFDHGDAFSFIFPILFAPDPATDVLEKLVEDHACRDWLRGREFSLQAFRDGLGRLTDEIFGQIVAETPADWRAGPAAGKLEYIVDVMKRRRDGAAEWLPKVEAWLSK